jgi:hypothetical protein
LGEVSELGRGEVDGWGMEWGRGRIRVCMGWEERGIVSDVCVRLCVCR